MSDLTIEQNIDLSSFTTLGLGGPADYLARIQTKEHLIEALQFAKNKNLKTAILGGGSNTIVPDDGFRGIVLLMQIGGMEVEDVDGTDKVIIKAGAGILWDHFVKYTCDRMYSGVECLSGIPGSVGAVPVQNVGAYGQEVSESIAGVYCIDKETLQSIKFSNEECRFAYRTSRFKEEDKGKYIITDVELILETTRRTIVRYPELMRRIEEKFRNGEALPIAAVRESVLDLRRSKSMIYDPADEESHSVGSFFINPVLDDAAFRNTKNLLCSLYPDLTEEMIPAFPAPSGMKISAAFLIEKAGFVKGYTKNGSAISGKHALSLVNKSGTTSSLLALAKEIKDTVYEKFKVILEIEAVIMN